MRRVRTKNAAALLDTGLCVIAPPPPFIFLGPPPPRGLLGGSLRAPLRGPATCVRFLPSSQEINRAVLGPGAATTKKRPEDTKRTEMSEHHGSIQVPGGETTKTSQTHCLCVSALGPLPQPSDSLTRAGGTRTSCQPVWQRPERRGWWWSAAAVAGEVLESVSGPAVSPCLVIC